jgi:hypothetical protein
MSTPAEEERGPGWLPNRLARVQAAAAEAKRKRDAQTECPHDHDGIELVHVFQNGAKHIYRGCADCHRPIEGGQWLPSRPSQEQLPIGIDDRMGRPPCTRCGAFGTELHHFAPRAVFGKEEADLWPTAWLCSGCHDYWHRMMKGAA